MPRLYTMLPIDAELVEELRFRYQKEALAKKSKPVDIDKSEIIRAGIYALSKMSNDQLYKAVEQVEELQEGRPPKEGRSSLFKQALREIKLEMGLTKQSPAPLAAKNSNHVLQENLEP